MSPRGFAPDTRLRVFIAHTRADVAFADQVGAFLHDAGLQPIIDRYETGGDGWQARLGDLISDADAVVLVLTPASAHSDLCAWSVDEAQRLGRRVVLVLPMPLGGVARGYAGLPTIHFYSDPTLPNSGFFDGQRRLLAALGGVPLERVSAERARAPAGPSPQQLAEQEARKARRVAERERKAERQLRKAEEREVKRRIREMTGGGPRFPTARVAFLGVFAVGVVGVIANPALLTQARSAWAEMSSAAATLAAQEEPYSPMNVPAEDYTSERDLVAVRGGANVRDYPLTSGTLIYEAPAQTRMRVTGRLKVQGKWWFRVELEDGRIGFVREDVVRWAAPERAAPPAAATPAPAGIAAIEPAIAVTAGRAGANLRTSPGRNARALVRLPAGAQMSATGKVRQGAHWWVRVALEDGRSGYVRDDVLTADSRTALDL